MVSVALALRLGLDCVALPLPLRCCVGEML